MLGNMNASIKLSVLRSGSADAYSRGITPPAAQDLEILSEMER
jgi:hypothetical protein